MSDDLNYIVQSVQRIEGKLSQVDDKVDDLGTRVSHMEGGIKVWKFVIPIGLTILLALVGYIAA